MKKGIELIAEERTRQIETEKFDANHDKNNARGELATAAACYLSYYYPHWAEDEATIPVPAKWPWDKQWWKPTPENRIKELTKAGALIAAEIDRINELNKQNKTD